MRKLDKKHLLIFLSVIAGILAFIFVPYWLSYTGIFFQPYSYSTPATPDSFIVTPNDTVMWGYIISEPKTLTEIRFERWIEGFGKFLLSVIATLGALFVAGLCFALYDWLFPEIQKRSD